MVARKRHWLHRKATYLADPGSSSAQARDHGGQSENAHHCVHRARQNGVGCIGSKQPALPPIVAPVRCPQAIPLGPQPRAHWPTERSALHRKQATGFAPDRCTCALHATDPTWAAASRSLTDRTEWVAQGASNRLYLRSLHLCAARKQSHLGRSLALIGRQNGVRCTGSKQPALPPIVAPVRCTQPTPPQPSPVPHHDNANSVHFIGSHPTLHSFFLTIILRRLEHRHRRYQPIG